MQKSPILSPKEGYNLIAPFYDSWKWQTFWKRNEYPYIKKWCDSLEKGRGADLGAGSGNNLKCFLDLGHRVTAYDISDLMLIVCQGKYATEITSGQLKCIVQNISELNVQYRQYDWLLCNRVLSHIKDISNVIRRMAHILKDAGECFISDVHPLHHYDHTHYKIGTRDFVIETYKHKIQEMTTLFYYNNFEIIEFKELSKSELFDRQIAENMHSIQDGVPIFYYYILRKR
jgi:2-polyprenyl-3-methyl-5-hydroxy-6-metoxy-1,4-benzoquinol methylase